MKKRLKQVGRLLLADLALLVVLAGVSVLKDGMYLLGVPSIDEVKKVALFFPSRCEQAREFSDSEEIALAVKLTGFLKYSLFQRPDEADSPLLTITYFYKDGRTASVSASRRTVWWNGKVYPLKETDIFLNLAEGLFFSDLPEEG